MRMTLAALAVLVTATTAGPSQARELFGAFHAPWCAIFSYSGGMDCGYYTLQQCRATLSGVGGVCEPNPHYRPQAARTSKRHHKRHRHIAN